MILIKQGSAAGADPRNRTEESDDGNEPDDRSNAGPPPSWDGTTSFRDYLVRARLWLATTKHLARDDTWMDSPQNGQLLLKMMDTKELYGEDEREEMLQSLVTEVKLLMNYTQGRLGQKDVKEWVRIHETDLDLKNKANGSKKPSDAVHYVEGEDLDPNDHDEPYLDNDEDIEVLLNAVQDLDDRVPTETTDDENGVFDEGEAREVLATMIKEHSKRRTFSAVNTAKKARNLARGLVRRLELSLSLSVAAATSAIGSSGNHSVNFLELGASEVNFLGFDEFKAIKEAVMSANLIMLPANKRSRADDPKDTGTWLESWRRMVLHFMVICTHAGRQAFMNYLMIRGPDGQAYKNCQDMIKQLSVAELKHLSSLVSQTLEVREIENMNAGSFIVLEPPLKEKIGATAPIHRCYCGQPVVVLVTRKEVGSSEPVISKEHAESTNCEPEDSSFDNKFVVDEEQLPPRTPKLGTTTPEYAAFLEFQKFQNMRRGQGSLRKLNGNGLSWSTIIGDKRRSAAAAQVYPNRLVDAILEAYARSDQERDKRYFLKHELDEIEVNLAVPERSLHQEILVNEEALDQPGGQDRPNEAEPALIRDLLPETYGISEEMIAKDGWSLVDNKVWLNSLENSREIPNPEPDHPAFNFPWRSSCVKENGSWRLLEDEVRWSGLALPDPARRVAPPKEETHINERAPTQRGLTERAGGVFKNILYKSMMDYGCQSRGEWLELVDIACMTRNRLLLRAGYSPIQRGYSPRLPGGLLSGGENDHMAADLIRIGDRDAVRAMKMRKAAAVAFHEADCDQALRAAALGGPRRFQNFEIGQAVYCWRRGAGTHKKTRDSYWHGPGRVLMTDLPNAVWISFNGTIVKAAPERVRHATPEEDLTISGAVNEPAEDAEIRGEVGEVISGSGVKREGGEDQAGPPEKRSRVQLLEIYHMHLQALSKQRARKEAKFSDFKGRDAVKLQNAIRKEIDNNLRTKAYQLLSPKESRDIRNNKPEKIMESRYVFTKKPIEPCETAAARIDGVLLEDEPGEACKAKARHVMKGYSEESALDVEFTTPQVNRDSVIFVLQVIASMGWVPGFLDFTQAFHSGDEINRELYCFQPKEGIPGAHPEQILKLLKTCYGLTDGPFAWYQHLARRLQEDFGYRPSQADPCVFMLHDRECPDGPRLEGIMGIATDDLVHGGSEKHWANVAQIAREYKLGKNQTGEGRFTGKHVKLELDGSITANQDFYVKEKVHDIPLTRKRKQQRYSRCTAQEVEQLRSSLGALSWLAKETRCDLAGRVSLLQQAFPEPKVSDLVEANRIASEARKFSHLGIKIMPIPWQDLRISVVTDAAWGNTKETPWIEDNPADHWQELPDRWIRHHVQARRTTFHPGAAPGGPDLHEIASRRLIDKYTATDQSLRHEQIEDEWSDQQGIRVLQEFPWTGQSIFFKQDAKEAKPSKIHSSLVQLQNLSSQGGQIVIYHHKSLSETERPAMTTVASWKSYRLKRKTVDTLAAEGQALQAGIGSVHWHRLLSSSRPSTACCRQVTGELLHVGSHFWRP
ncbi:RE1 [Symbiodinium pilosum]|uniref:RE1 protein n=1 Tax=Symbiodinium pilosum TaxID=2952 RepID=A0A812IT36_SYMPI|nr:RE1 [Symbiodinium pilosum]